MKFIFLRIKTDARNYVEQKLKTLLVYTQPGQPAAPPSAAVTNALSHVGRPAPRIASEEEFFRITKAQDRLVDVSRRCALQEVAEHAPLADNEQVESDFFSYLLEPFDDLPAYTAVLKRTTNMAEILYFFELVKIDNGKLVHFEAPAASVPQLRPRLKGGFDITGALIKKLLKEAGKAAASGALSKAGAFIVDLVIKQMFGDDQQKMLDEIKKMVKDEIEGNELAKVDGAINGTMLFLRTEYKNLKAKADLNDKALREKLLDKLDRHSGDFYNVTGFLMSEKYSIRGLKTFMMAAPVHLLLMQEMALVDPDDMDPNKSTYLKTLRELATHYRKHVHASFNRALSQRNNMEVVVKPFVDCMGNSCVSKNTYWWRDNVSHEEAGEFMGTKDPKRSAWEVASASLDQHRNAVLKKLTEDLGNPQQTFLDEIGALENYTFTTPEKAGLRLSKKPALKKSTAG